jgi:hypothetical protein
MSWLQLMSQHIDIVVIAVMLERLAFVLYAGWHALAACSPCSRPLTLVMMMRSRGCLGC